MPIRPSERERYPINWTAISHRIRFERAAGQCECAGQCGMHIERRCEEIHGRRAKFAKGYVILTVAHLDHQPENVKDSNLLALCQRCHLRYDTEHHNRTRKRCRD